MITTANTGRIYPLDAPGMPVPGTDFIATADAAGEEKTLVTGKGKTIALESYSPQLLELYKRVLYSPGTFGVRMTVRQNQKNLLRVVAGHKWGETTPTGPEPADVMVIGKMLGEQEIARRVHFIGATGELLLDTVLESMPTGGCDAWYMTNLLKTHHPLGLGNSTLKQSWVREWLPVLHQELRLVRPKYILCLGADVSKALLGKQATIMHMEGRLKELKYPISTLNNGSTQYHTALVMTVVHPAAVIAEPAWQDKFENGISRFVQLIHGQRWDKEEEGLDHRVVDDLDTLRSLSYEIEADIEDNLLGVDAEWHGQHPQNAGSYLRCFQVSWKHKAAATICFRGVGGKRLYTPREYEEVLRLVNQICRGKQLAGHFFDADLEFLVPNGIDLREQYAVPATWQQYMRDCLANAPVGFDTGYAAHALNETDDYGLTTQSIRNTTAPRYDDGLMDWKRAYCKEHGLKDAELEGFGDCPDDVLIGERSANGRVRQSYSCYDADVARRLALKRRKQLCCDLYGNNCWEAFWMNMRVLPAVLEINTHGIVVDRDRVDTLTDTYMASRAAMEQRVREWARWPELNLNSVYQVRELLFGESLNGHPIVAGKPRRLRPRKGEAYRRKLSDGTVEEGVYAYDGRTLRLDPIMTTDKRPMLWPDVLKQGLVDEKTASTNKTALAILAEDSQAVVRQVAGENRELDLSKYVTWVRDYRFISQVLKSSLRPPVWDEEEEVYRKDADGHYVFAGGLAASLCDDGRVRTHMYPTKETARWASARPPLHNLTKRRESDYKRILGDAYQWPLRTIVKAGEGRVLVEADYVGAELFGMAVMSGDPTMIAHAMRNQLPEDHPEYYDIHSNVAVLAFRLDCEPTKSGLERIGKIQLRVAAKNVIFGIAYGRGAKAIALQAKEEGNPITIEEAQRIIDTVLEMYPGLTDFFTECRDRVLGPRYLCGCFGRYRRFPIARERAKEGDFEREGRNFPIQNLVADAVNRAVDHLTTVRSQYSRAEFWFDIVLQMHDALLFEVEYRHVPKLIDEILPYCMVDRVPIYPTYLDGKPKPVEEPFYLGIDVEVGKHWGELLLPDEFEHCEISPSYGGWKQEEAGWRHQHKKTDHVWRAGEWIKLAS